MRFRDIQLKAFGHFTDAELQLVAPGPALHVIYGPNEAGKSTALRALIGLLYGIDERTKDAFLHPANKLRVAATLELAGGAVLSLVRRKGRKNTLLAPDGSPLDDDVLTHVLGGIGEKVFCSMFGLDHTTLRSGAAALLEGKGDVGQSLFDAGAGGRGIQQVLARLDEEADELFAPKASKPPLNRALAAYKEATKKLSDDALSDRVWQTQRSGIEEVRTRRDEFDRQRRELLAEKLRLKRHERVIPQLIKLESLRARHSELGEHVQVAEEASHKRIDAQRAIDQSTEQLTRLQGEIATLEERLSQLDVPERLARVPEAVVEELSARLAAHRKAAADLPKREAELALLEDGARDILRAMQRSVPLEQVESLRVGSDQMARIRALAQRWSGVDAALRDAQEAVLERKARLTQLRQRLSDTPPAPELGPLRSAVDAARKLGDIEQRAQELQRSNEQAAKKAQRRLDSLGQWRGALEQVPHLAVPSDETVQRFEQAWTTLQVENSELTARERDRAGRQTDLERQLQALEGAGDVPTETQLLEARAARDARWMQIVQTGKVQENQEAFVGAIEHADMLADRLRREAERVSRHAALVADLNALGREHTRNTEDSSALEARRAGVVCEWNELFAHIGVTPLPPREMRAWLQRLEELKRMAGALHDGASQLQDLQARVDEHRQALLQAMASLDSGPLDAHQSLRSLLESASETLERGRTAASSRQTLVEQLAVLEAEVTQQENRASSRAEALTQWQASWAASIACIGLAPQALPEEATAVLDDLSNLFSGVDKASELRRRVSTMRRDADKLQVDAAQVCAQALPELADQPIESRIDELVQSHRRMRSNLQQRQTAEQDLSAKHGERERYLRLEQQAQATLAKLMSEAKVDSMESLVEAEQRSADARQLLEQKRATEEALLEAGEGAPIAALMEEVRDTTADAVRIRLAYIDDDIERVSGELQDASTELGSREQGLRVLTQSSAADAAADAQAQLASIREGAVRYARTRLAAVILRSEIERYRKENQGPILTRASELFPKLTTGRYSGLSVGYDEDTPVLRCHRAHDELEVDVGGLSDGTRDQLYLALRLASLERHASRNEPMPVILDDILIHFDDERARAALKALEDLASLTQVLFFTHHTRLVELARQAVTPARLAVHDLSAAALLIVQK